MTIRLARTSNWMKRGFKSYMMLIENILVSILSYHHSQWSYILFSVNTQFLSHFFHQLHAYMQCNIMYFLYRCITLVRYNTQFDLQNIYLKNPARLVNLEPAIIKKLIKNNQTVKVWLNKLNTGSPKFQLRHWSWATLKNVNLGTRCREFYFYQLWS